MQCFFFAVPYAHNGKCDLCNYKLMLCNTYRSELPHLCFVIIISQLKINK